MSRAAASRRLRDDVGMVTAFVTIFTLALIMVIGLVLDGGYLVAARRQAANEAESAARAGAQALSIDAVRSSGDIVLDESAARARVASYMARTGHRHSVRIDGDQVIVTVQIDRSPLILGIGGLSTITVTGSGSARPVTGPAP